MRLRHVAFAFGFTLASLSACAAAPSQLAECVDSEEIEVVKEQGYSKKVRVRREVVVRDAEKRRRCAAAARGAGTFIAVSSPIVVPTGPEYRTTAIDYLRRDLNYTEKLGVAFDRIDFVGVAGRFPVYVGAGVLAFEVANEGRELLVLTPGHQRGFEDQEIASIGITLVSLEDLTTRPISLDLDIMTRAVGVARVKDGVIVRSFARFDEGSNRLRYLRCSTATSNGQCVEARPADFPKSYLEATAAAGYRITALPDGIALPARVLRRSVQRSPDGKQLAWIEETPQPRGTSRFHLFVGATTAGARDGERVAEVAVHGQARWLDSDRLLFDPLPKNTPAYAQALAVAKRRYPEAWTDLERIRKLPEDAEDLSPAAHAAMTEDEVAALGVDDRVGYLGLLDEQPRVYQRSTKVVTPFAADLRAGVAGGVVARYRTLKHFVEERSPDSLAAVGASCAATDECSASAMCCTGKCTPTCDPDATGCVRGCLDPKLARPTPTQSSTEIVQGILKELPAKEAFDFFGTPNCEYVPISTQLDSASLQAKLRKPTGLFVLGTSGALDAAGGTVVTPLASMGLALTRGRSTQGPITVPHDRIEYLECGVHAPIVIGKPIQGFALFGQQLVAVHVAERAYVGANQPYPFTGSLTRVSLPSLETKTFTWAGQPQSIAVAVDAAGQLLVRLDATTTARCDEKTGQCAPDATVTFPTRDYLEITAVAGYRVANAAGVKSPKNARRRSVWPSPAKTAVAFVTEEIERRRDAYAVVRSLWVQRASGKPQRIAKGEGELHAMWLDADRLLYEEPPRASPLYSRVRSWLEKNGGVERALTNHRNHRTSVDEKLAVDFSLDSEALGVVVEATTTIAALQTERLRIYRLSTGHDALFVPDPHLRLFSETRAPNLRGDKLIEVP